MIKVSLECIDCKLLDVIKAGENKSPSNRECTQRYNCKNCMKSFQKDYKHLARLPSVKEKIIEWQSIAPAQEISPEFFV